MDMKPSSYIALFKQETTHTWISASRNTDSRPSAAIGMSYREACLLGSIPKQVAGGLSPKPNSANSQARGKHDIIAKISTRLTLGTLTFYSFTPSNSSICRRIKLQDRLANHQTAQRYPSTRSANSSGGAAPQQRTLMPPPQHQRRGGSLNQRDRAPAAGPAPAPTSSSAQHARELILSR